MPRSGWGGGWSSGAERESEASAGGVRAVIRQILEVVPGGILRAGKTIFGAGSGWWIGRDADGAGKVDIGSESRYLRFDGVDLTWRSDHTALEADGTLTAVNGYFSGVLDAPVLDLELMKLCFASISWAQFAVFEAFSDESGRADPDPSSPEARGHAGPAVERWGRDAGAVVRLPVQGIRGALPRSTRAHRRPSGRGIWKTRRGPGSPASTRVSSWS